MSYEEEDTCLKEGSERCDAKGLGTQKNPGCQGPAPREGEWL